MAIKRVSDLETRTRDYINKSGVDLKSSTYLNSLIEVSESANSAGSQFVSKAYQIGALVDIFKESITGDDSGIPVVWKVPVTFLSSVIIQRPGYLSCNGDAYFVNCSVDFQNVAFHVNDRRCSTSAIVSISSYNLSVGSSNNALLYAKDMTIKTTQNRLNLLGYSGITISSINSGQISVLNNSDIILSSKSNIKIYAPTIELAGNDITLNYSNSCIIKNGTTNIIKCQKNANNTNSISTSSSKANPISGYINHALWS